MSVYRRVLALISLVPLLVAGCGSAEPILTSVPVTATRIAHGSTGTPRQPTATPLPPSETLVPPSDTPVAPTETATATPTDTAIPLPTGTATPLPPVSGSGGGVIAFTSERDGNSEIYRMNADGSDPQRLTDDPAYDAWPSWSPDGAQIAFMSDRSGNADVYVMNADGSDVRQLTVDPASDIWPDWSPDGTRIAFPSRRDGNFEIYLVNADGSNLQRLTDTAGHEDFPAWSPDGTEIVYSRSEGDDGTFVMSVPDGTGAGGVERPLMDILALEPAWSPDGTRIVFGSDHEGFRGIYVIDADGANLQRLSDIRAGENCPEWSPDGTRIVFASWRDGDGEIYVMDADGVEQGPRNLHQLTDNRRVDEFPAWQPVASDASPDEGASLGDTWLRTADGMTMVYVPGGEFQMGSDDDEVDAALEMCRTYHTTPCQRAWFEVEQPVHTVVLDGIWLDRTEVTNAQYRRCVEAGACSPPRRTSSGTRHAYYGDPAYDDYPVVHVAWGQADAYCRWVEGRLPTEAEWEHAARGPEGRRYPWGEEYDGSRLNSCDLNCAYAWAEEAFDDGHDDTAPVGSYPNGASWCGVLDLAGNVWEWMADWFGEYPSERQSNPTGPPFGSGRALRGDAADGTRSVSRAAARHGMDPQRTYAFTGFRCAASTLPPGATGARSPETDTPTPAAISVDTVGQVLRLSTLSGHSDRVMTLDFSGDGAYLASSSTDGTIKVWDAKSGQELHTYPKSVNEVITNDIALSQDGTLLASAYAIWDVESEQVIHTLERGRSAAVAFSPDGSLLAVALGTQPIKLWDVTSGQVVRTFDRQADNAAFSIVFSPDGTLLAAGGLGGTVRLWDVESGASVGTLEYGDESGVHDVAFSPDGSLLASGGTDSAVRLWDVASGQAIHTMGLRDGLFGVAFSPDGTILASAGGLAGVRLWDVESGKMLRHLPHDDELMALAFSPDGTLLATGGYDNQVYLWGLPH